MSSGAIQGGFNKSWEQKNKHINPKAEEHYHIAMSNWQKNSPRTMVNLLTSIKIKKKTGIGGDVGSLCQVIIVAFVCLLPGLRELH